MWEKVTLDFSFVFLFPGVVVMKYVYLHHTSSCGNPVDSLPVSVPAGGLSTEVPGLCKPEVQGQMWDDAVTIALRAD